MSTSWIRLERRYEEGEGPCGWELVVDFDTDWQNWKVGADGASIEFSLYVPDDYVEGLNIPRVEPGQTAPSDSPDYNPPVPQEGDETL